MPRITGRNAAFTLVELIVALAVTAVMVAVALPSLSTLARNNAWNDGVQRIASCIRAAQGEAASPTYAGPTSEWYVTAELSLSGTTLTCQTYRYVTAGNAVPYFGGGLSYPGGGTAGRIPFGSAVSMSDVSSSPSSPAVPSAPLTFGVANRGEAMASYSFELDRSAGDLKTSYSIAAGSRTLTVTNL